MKYIITFLLLHFFHISYCQNGYMLFQNYNVSNGLSQNTVIRSLEDSDGYMWFCTRDGLNRFDGTDFKVIKANGQANSLSSSDVTTIVEERPGILWIGSHYGLNRYDIDNNSFTQYFHDPADSHSISDNCIKHLLCDNKKRIWIGNMKGLNLYNKETDDFVQVSTNGSVFWLMQNSKNEICYLINNTLCIMNPETFVTERYQFGEQEKIYFLYEDSDKRLWVGMWNTGLKWFNRKTGKLISAKLTTKKGEDFNNSQVNYIVETMKGELMLATRDGVLIYNKQDDILSNVYQKEDGCGLSENTIISLYRDKTNNIWVGTYGGGVNLYTPYSNFFIPHNPEYKLQKSIGNINAMIEYKGNLWLGTDEGLIIYNPQKECYEYSDLKLPSSKENNEIKYIQKEGEKYLWISIYYCGLYLYDMETRQIVKEIKKFPYNQVRCITKDCTGTYWIALGVDSPVLRYQNNNDLLSETFPVKDRMTEFSMINVQDLKSIGPYVWMGTRSTGLYRYNVLTQELKHYGRKENILSQYIPSDHVSTLYIDPSGNFWIGTYGGGIGIYNENEEKFIMYNSQHGLLNNAINSIVSDDFGKLWISTLEGMSCFDPQTKIFTNWSNRNGYTLLETNLHACLKDTNGIIYVGGNNCFLSFSPKLQKKNEVAPTVKVTELKIWPDYNGGDKINHWINNTTHQIKLGYKQTSFTIKFSALSYVFSSNNQYSYKLEGFDNNWSAPTYESSANYTNIPPGEYTFKVKACNNDGIWNQNDASLTIIITPPMWKTWYAYTFYIIFIICMISLFFRYRMREAKLKMDLHIKQMEKQNIELTHKMGVKMFTNFSHELRTPLTLIIAPLSDLLQHNDIPQVYRRSLELINRNSQKLLWLVNSLMDFHKLEAGKMELNVNCCDMGSYVSEIINLFSPIIQKRNISIDFNDATCSTKVWFDTNLIEKVFFNLISNSLKNTPNGGYIIISSMIVHTDDLVRPQNINLPAEKVLLTKVEDSGLGIPAEKMPHIFESFFQANDKIQGSGIGLNLTKSIIELHGGQIWIESQEGHGATVYFTLKFKREDYSTNQIIKKEQFVKSSNQLHSEIKALIASDTDYDETSPTKIQNQTYTILIIEDNKDVRDYLVSLLNKYYTIHIAEDCKKGYEIEQKIIPDLVVSDIITPYMNGLEFTKLSKNNIITSHIPIILLTARTTELQMKEGYESLADDYIMKPFNPELLKVRISSILINRQKLAKCYAAQIVTSDKQEPQPQESHLSTYNVVDERFMKRVMEIIHKNIEDPAYSIDQFSSEIGMSRVQVYRKIKAVTGMSPSKLILNIRLRQAVEMLKHSNLTITEISYRCGFNEISYFGKCFKTEYGIPPSEFIRKYRE